MLRRDRTKIKEHTSLLDTRDDRRRPSAQTRGKFIGLRRF
jgi:hypothetical protein